MIFLLLYDIGNDKMRGLLSKYIEGKGGFRIQKSTFLINSDSEIFNEIYSSVTCLEEYCEKNDSIIIVQIPMANAQTIKTIGKKIPLSRILKTEKTIFV